MNKLPYRVIEGIIGISILLSSLGVIFAFSWAAYDAIGWMNTPNTDSTTEIPTFIGKSTTNTEEDIKERQEDIDKFLVCFDALSPTIFSVSDVVTLHNYCVNHKDSPYFGDILKVLTRGNI